MSANSSLGTLQRKKAVDVATSVHGTIRVHFVHTSKVSQTQGNLCRRIGIEAQKVEPLLH